MFVCHGDIKCVCALALDDNSRSRGSGKSGVIAVVAITVIVKLYLCSALQNKVTKNLYEKNKKVMLLLFRFKNEQKS